MACAKGLLAGTCENRHPLLAVGLKGVEGCLQLTVGGRIQCVMNGRSIDRNNCECVLALNRDEFVHHGVSIARFCVAPDRRFEIIRSASFTIRSTSSLQVGTS